MDDDVFDDMREAERRGFTTRKSPLIADLLALEDRLVGVYAPDTPGVREAVRRTLMDAGRLYLRTFLRSCTE